MLGKPGRPKKGEEKVAIGNLNGGNQTTYTLARLRRDAPELAERVEAGELSANAAAIEWTQRYASGRTDADFGELIGMSADQVYQRRRVWGRFRSSDTYRKLSWSHHYLVLTRDDAEDWLDWASRSNAAEAKERQKRKPADSVVENLPQQTGKARDKAGELSLSLKGHFSSC